jgi:hypothetical protein
MSIGHRSKCGMIDGCPVSRIGGRMRKERRYAQDRIAQVDNTRDEQPHGFARPATTLVWRRNIATISSGR